jgi:ADP-ribose pyrophosphatase
MAWKTISSETVFRGRVLAVRVDRMRLPNGRETQLDIVEHGGSVVIVPVDEEDGILFVRQYRHAAGGDLLELPAGTLEPGEDPQACAGRELREETGMGTRMLDEIGGFYLAPGYSTEFMRVFLATQLFPGRLPGDEDEFLSMERFPRADVRRMLASGSLDDAKTVAALALFFSRAAPPADG